MNNIPKMLRAEALIADEDWTGIYGISPNLAFAAAAQIEKLEAALREIAGNGNAIGCNPQIMCDIARKALDAE